MKNNFIFAVLCILTIIITASGMHSLNKKLAKIDEKFTPCIVIVSTNGIMKAYNGKKSVACSNPWYEEKDSISGNFIATIDSNNFYDFKTKE